jgi:hypothetical protein
MVRIVPQKELTNNRMYGLKLEHRESLCTIKRWGEWRKVKMCPMKYAMPNNGGIQLTGSQGAPKSRTYS